jgi:hypothetical protein
VSSFHLSRHSPIPLFGAFLDVQPVEHEVIPVDFPAFEDCHDSAPISFGSEKTSPIFPLVLLVSFSILSSPFWWVVMLLLTVFHTESLMLETRIEKAPAVQTVPNPAELVFREELKNGGAGLAPRRDRFDYKTAIHKWKALLRLHLTKNLVFQVNQCFLHFGLQRKALRGRPSQQGMNHSEKLDILIALLSQTLQVSEEVFSALLARVFSDAFWYMANIIRHVYILLRTRLPVNGRLTFTMEAAMANLFSLQDAAKQL